jgi:hypothetical protein
MLRKLTEDRNMFYNPSLGVVCLALIATSMIARDWRLSRIRAIHLSLGLIIAYGLMSIDNSLGIWDHFGLDYSTHTAVAVILVTYLSVHTQKLAAAWIVSLIGYFTFMMYMGYHTFTDIFTTTIVVLLPLLLAMRYLNSFKPLTIRSYKILGSAGAS